MKTEHATIAEVHAKRFVAVPDGTDERITCHFNARRHLEPGLTQPVFSAVKRAVQDGDVKVGAKVVFRRHDTDPFVASRWETLEAYEKQDKQRQASWNRGAKQPVML